jgi:phage tail-like protein
MAEFSVNATRLDPYKNFKFRLIWDTRPVAGVSKVSALKVTREVIDHRSGGDPSTVRPAPGQSKHEPITLERGVTHDTEFEKWSNKVWNLGSGLGSEVSLGDFRKDIRLELLNESGQVAKAWNIYRCWVSEYSSLGELDANGNAVVFESLVLQNEGWERDYEVTEPNEPTFTEPAS